MRLLLFFTIFSPFVLFAQKKKEVFAEKIQNSILIDGNLNESLWEEIEPAKHFTMIEPINGKIERSNETTIVKFAYNDYALYIGARLNDKNGGYDDPNMLGIMKELGARDEQGKSADVFGIFLNPFNDGINEFAFLVTAAGVQIDKRIILTTGGYLEDLNWDAVWESAVAIDKDGWSVEIKIPYSAIRFPNKEVQEWGLNIYRVLRRFREEYSWNFIDTRKKHVGNQAGILKGIQNINPPIRLSMTPYVTTVMLKEPTNPYNFQYSGGIDLKYGFKSTILDEGFNCTLDMTVLPEFQQIEFDPLVLNISPFETQYDEKRSFFTEGIELFKKGNLFYSRRIGGSPVGELEINENEIITDNPTNTQLYNASKISGRTNDGWGIGIFNAFTKNTYSEITDTITNTIREILIEPITHYSMLVVDKSFKQNSFLTFVNTNVHRPNQFRKANVLGLLGSITNNPQTHSYDLSLKSSFIRNENNMESGFASSFGVSNINSNFRYSFQNYIESDKYDINDMGFLYQNNEVNTNISIAYNIFSSDEEYAKRLNILKGESSLSIEHKMLYKPFTYNKFILKFDSWAVTKKHLWVNLRYRYFFEEIDYFEARINNQKFIKPPATKISMSTSSNFNHPIALNLSGSVKYRLSSNYAIWENYHNTHFYVRFNPRIRVNNHIFFQYILALENEKNQFGWITSDENQLPIFSRRTQNTVTNKFIFNYTFSNKLYFKTVLRYYWSTINNEDFYVLLNNGELSDTEYPNNHNINFNTWNLDCNLSWEYRAGSQLSIVWQNQLTHENQEIENIFFNNMNNFFENPTTNVFSIKFTSYLDYSTIFKP